MTTTFDIGTARARLAALCASALAACALVGCPGRPPVDVPDQGAVRDCVDSSECPDGHVCSNAVCTPGTCDPGLEAQCDAHSVDSPLCCKPWQNCDVLALTCAPDPAVHGIGCDPADASCTPCNVDGDCSAGQFCSSATCLDVAGRASCSTSFDCPSEQRCDERVGLCVPDRGACSLCGDDFPEVCCDDGQGCSLVTDSCETIGADPCTSDADCGPGLTCDTGVGTCFAPDDVCTSDADCSGDFRCTAVGECVVPGCTSDGDCEVGSDARRSCDLATFTCFLPAPVCPPESDEPNNDIAHAVALTGGLTYSGTVCRDDVDVLSFPVDANKFYVATVAFAFSGMPGLAVSLLDETGAPVSTAVTGDLGPSLIVAQTTDAAGTLYLRVAGTSTFADSYAYTVALTISDAPPPADCSGAGTPEEPNDDFAHATVLTIGGTTTFSRCGVDDVDFYAIAVPALNGIKVTLAGFANAAGNLDVTLFTGADVTSALPGGQNTNDVEQVVGPEGPATYFLRVALGSPNGAVDDQSYTISTVEVPRPAACDPDPTEDDGSIATAAQLTLAADPSDGGNLDARLDDVVRCIPQDVDMFRFTMPANLGGAATIRFEDNEGDMALDLLDGNGTTIATSNTSTPSSGIEQVLVPGDIAPHDFFIRAHLATTTGGIIAQHYSVAVTTFDNSQCLASEPAGGDDVFQNGRCIGDFTPTRVDQPCVNDAARIAEPMDPGGLAVCDGVAAGAVDGCGLMCGNTDADWYRVGPLANQQVLHARLDYDASAGRLELIRGTLSPVSGAVNENLTSDSDGDGHVELSFVALSPLELGVAVRAQGVTGHLVERYALLVEVGPPCFDDENDAAASNETPATATLIRVNPQAGVPFTFDSADLTTTLSRCDNDVDVYEIFSFAGETVSVALTAADNSPAGLVAELGARPADLNTPATSLVPAVVAAGDGTAATFANPTAQTLYVTVSAAPGVVVTGPYVLVVSTTP